MGDDLLGFLKPFWPIETGDTKFTKEFPDNPIPKKNEFPNKIIFTYMAAKYRNSNNLLENVSCKHLPTRKNI